MSTFISHPRHVEAFDLRLEHLQAMAQRLGFLDLKEGELKRLYDAGPIKKNGRNGGAPCVESLIVERREFFGEWFWKMKMIEDEVTKCH